MTAEEVQLASSRGAQLQNQYSGVRHEAYLANTCPQCGVMTGSHYLHDFWDLANEETGTVTGGFCPQCAEGGLID